MAANEGVTLSCGCQVETSRDFLGRVVGKIITRGSECPREDHVAGHSVLMPGREHAGDNPTIFSN